MLYVVVFDIDELDFKGTDGREKHGNYFEYLPCCEEIEILGNIYQNSKMYKEIKIHAYVTG